MKRVARVEAEFAVIGAGAAGCAAALELLAAGREVVLIDRAQGPVTRFCGEFLSGEATAPLEWLGISPDRLGAQPIVENALYGSRGTEVRTRLPIAARGLSRRTLDGELLRQAIARGAQAFTGVAVEGLTRGDSGFEVSAGDVRVLSRHVIGAWGRRSPIDRLLGRRFLERDSDWIGVKAHFRSPSPSEEVGLYLFPGGHGGVVNVDGDRATLGILARRSALQRAGKPTDLISAAREANSSLDRRLGSAELDAGSILTIGQVALVRKKPVESGVLLVGDAAGVTAPFLGLGVTNAIRSGSAAARALLSARDPAGAYLAWRRRTIDRRQRLGYAASAGLSSPWVGEAAVAALAAAPRLMRGIYSFSRTPEPA